MAIYTHFFEALYIGTACCFTGSVEYSICLMKVWQNSICKDLVFSTQFWIFYLLEIDYTFCILLGKRTHLFDISYPLVN